VVCGGEAAEIGKEAVAEVVHLFSMTVICSADEVDPVNHGVAVIELLTAIEIVTWTASVF
jgi:hypothetical protein